MFFSVCFKKNIIFLRKTEKKYTVASATEKFTKWPDLYSSLDPLMYTFRNYEDLSDNLDVLHHHCAKIFDIIIRKTVYAAGGNMESKFWFGLDSPGYNAQIGNWITNHKKQSGFGGAEMMNKLSRQMQSNKALKLDHTLEIHMNVFNELRKTDRTGKGETDEEEEPETVTLPKRGVRRTGIRDYHLSRYFGDSLVVECWTPTCHFFKLNCFFNKFLCFFKILREKTKVQPLRVPSVENSLSF
ncbi:hypothetical protein CAEBREN_17506 [Caenorhabditis brenneri]|uniref:Uncharacterized protein n=1 Tax=Caenorhabditis brenneri TaxID=135651 RepID=G0N1K0_CAEBE|nr:hypothetical protein CAEBREN_17506 [Caenorhabditis brenneri]